MQIKRFTTSALLLGLAASLPSHASAQVGIAARGSTLGVGAELSYRLNKHIGLRVGGNFFSLTKDVTIENIDYSITPHLENGTAILDLYLRGAFHLSGGLLLNNNQGRLVAHANQNIEIGGTIYTPQQIGSLLGTLSFRKAAPYLGLGFGGKGKFALLFDLGVGVTGTPRVNLVGTTPLTGAAKTEFDANVAEELAELRSNIQDKSYLKFHPVLSLGLRIRI